MDTFLHSQYTPYCLVRARFGVVVFSFTARDLQAGVVIIDNAVEYKRTVLYNATGTQALHKSEFELTKALHASP